MKALRPFVFLITLGCWVTINHPQLHPMWALVFAASATLSLELILRRNGD